MYAVFAFRRHSSNVAVVPTAALRHATNVPFPSLPLTPLPSPVSLSLSLSRPSVRSRMYQDHPSTVASLSYLAVTLRAQGKTRKGDSLLRHAGELRSASRARARSSSSRRGDSWGSKEDAAAAVGGQPQLGDGGSLWGGGQEPGMDGDGGGGGGGGAGGSTTVVSVNPIAVYE